MVFIEHTDFTELDPTAEMEEIRIIPYISAEKDVADYSIPALKWYKSPKGFFDVDFAYTLLKKALRKKDVILFRSLVNAEKGLFHKCDNYIEDRYLYYINDIDRDLINSIIVIDTCEEDFNNDSDNMVTVIQRQETGGCDVTENYFKFECINNRWFLTEYCSVRDSSDCR